MKYINIKLWDILGCFHYILNAPRMLLITSHFVHRLEIYEACNAVIWNKASFLQSISAALHLNVDSHFQNFHLADITSYDIGSQKYDASL